METSVMQVIGNEERILRELREAIPIMMSSWEPVDPYSVHQWCQVFDIRNDRYVRRREIPGAMLHSWTMPGYRETYPEGDVVDPLRASARALSSRGYVGTMAVRLQQSYRAVINYGDRLRRRARIESISPLKDTTVGKGYFVTEASDTLSEHGVVGSTKLTLFVFKPNAQQKQTSGSLSAEAHCAPTLTQDLTTRFIVAASMATRDFEDVHLDPDSARSKGGENVYVNIMTTLSLIQKATEAAVGEGNRIQSVDVSLLSPAYPGDMIEFYVTAEAPNRALIQAQLSNHMHAKATVQFSN